MLAYLLRRVPHCGDFFAHPLGGATEAIWLHTVGSRSKASPDRKKRPGTSILMYFEGHLMRLRFCLSVPFRFWILKGELPL